MSEPSRPVPAGVAHPITSHQVVQRTSPDGAELRLEGALDRVPGELRLVGPHGAVNASAALTSTRWRAALCAPVGGPYDLVVRDGAGEERLIAADVLVGDIWILAGQSNMQGYGLLGDKLEPPDPRVHVFDMGRRWRLATDPLHVLSLSPDPAYSGFVEADRQALREFDATGTVGAGLGVSFGVEMVRRTGVPVGLITAALGGTTLAMWSPENAGEGAASLFGSTLRSVAAAGGHVAGVLWFQGESDALLETPGPYAEELARLVEGWRTQLADDVRFFHVQIGRVAVAHPLPGGEPQWSAIRELQRRFRGADGMTASIDLHLVDGTHVDTESLRRVGRRLALLASGAAATIDLHGVTLGADGCNAVIAFDNVTGRLHSDLGRVPGFSVRTGENESVNLIFHAAVEASGNEVRLHFSRPPLPGECLWYGFGHDPFCTLVDDNDMPVPAFGPLPLLPVD